MAESFDPYLQWLGIRDPQRPPNHYRLLGVELLEADLDVISNAADRQMAHVRTFQTGQYSALSQKILNELAAAKLGLLQPEKKAAYDAELRAKIKPAAVAKPVPKAKPMPATTAAPQIQIATNRPAGGARPEAKGGGWKVPTLVGVVVLAIGGVVVALNPFGGSTKGPNNDGSVAVKSGSGISETAKTAAEPKSGETAKSPAAKTDESLEKTPEPLPVKTDEPPRKSEEPAVEPPPEKTIPDPTENKTPFVEPDPPAKEADPEPVAAQPKLLPPPSPDEEKNTEAKIREAFKDDFTKAGKDPQKLAALAEKTLLKYAVEDEKDPLVRYVLLRMVRDLCSAAGQVVPASKAIDELSKTYDVPAATTLKSFERLANMVKSAEAGRELATLLLAKGEKALAASGYEDAVENFKLAFLAAKSDAELKARITSLRTETEAARKSVETLTANPADPAANLRVGRFECFIVGNWSQGLKRLAQGNDAALKALADKELAQPDEPADQVAIADGWTKLLDKEKGPAVRPQISAHAREWYDLALPKLTGIEKTRVESQLKKLEDTALAASPVGPKKNLAPLLTLPLGSNAALKLKLIPAGKYMQGPPGQQRPVTLTRPFYMGVTEVTEGQWKAVLNRLPANAAQQPNLPVQQVSWEDCQQFIAALQQSPLGRQWQFRLPTEAEWEYACRAGSTAAYSFGPVVVDAQMWHKGNSGGKVNAVDSRPVNAFGLSDMHGNVMEWCLDWHVNFGPQPAVDPVGPPQGTRRVLRGGAFYNAAENCASFYRQPEDAKAAGTGYGMRLVVTPLVGKSR